MTVPGIGRPLLASVGTIYTYRHAKHTYTYTHASARERMRTGEGYREQAQAPSLPVDDSSSAIAGKRALLDLGKANFLIANRCWVGCSCQQSHYRIYNHLEIVGMAGEDCFDCVNNRDRKTHPQRVKPFPGWDPGLSGEREWRNSMHPTFCFLSVCAMAPLRF